jgi:hypothetical protein
MSSLSTAVFVRTVDGAVEVVSIDQEHPAQVFCQETELWVMPLLDFPALVKQECNEC